MLSRMPKPSSSAMSNRTKGDRVNSLPGPVSPVSKQADRLQGHGPQGLFRSLAVPTYHAQS